MRHFLRVFLTAVVVALAAGLPENASAQIPNSGFENWTNGIPAGGWVVDNSPGFAPIVQSTSAHSGSYALEGSTLSLYGQAIPPAAIISFPFTQRPATFTGYYKFTSVGGDSFTVAVAFEKDGGGVGGYTTTLPVASSYTQFSLSIFWDPSFSGTPDTCDIGFETTGPQSVHAGTTFYIDDISFSPTTAVNEAGIPYEFRLDQNYPNPFNPTTAISYELSSVSNVTLKVYDILGREVASLVSARQNPGSYTVNFDGSGLPSGVYFYRLVAGTSTAMKKLVLLK